MVLKRQKGDTYLDNTESTTSRYRLTNMHIDSEIKVGTRRFGLWKRPPIDETGADNWIKHTITRSQEQRIDNLSQLYYERPDYWWAIASVNKIHNSLEDISIGDTLIIPPLSSIELALGIK